MRQAARVLATRSERVARPWCFFPHLRAGAARRLLSSKPKPGTSEKVPKHPEEFRHFATISNFVRECASFASRNSSGLHCNGTDAALGGGDAQLDQNPITRHTGWTDANLADRTLAGSADGFSHKDRACTDARPSGCQLRDTTAFLSNLPRPSGGGAPCATPQVPFSRHEFPDTCPRADGFRRRSECHRIRGREGFIESFIQHFVECWRPLRHRPFDRFFLAFRNGFHVVLQSNARIRLVS